MKVFIVKLFLYNQSIQKILKYANISPSFTENLALSSCIGFSHICSHNIMYILMYSNLMGIYTIDALIGLYIIEKKDAIYNCINCTCILYALVQQFVAAV